MGGHLAAITSEKEQAFIEQLNKDSKKLWIGAYRNEYFLWYWVTGEKWNYTNWKAGEPNNQGTETCGAVWPNNKLTYSKISGTPKIKISSSGKITVPQRLKRGTYVTKVKATAVGNSFYKKTSKIPDNQKFS